MYEIYYLRCPESKCIRYVGQTRKGLQFRLNCHFQEFRRNSKSNKTLTYKENWFRSLKDYTKITIHLIEQVDKASLGRREQEIIREYKQFGHPLTNTLYSEQNTYFSEETRRKLSESKLGAKNPMYGKRTKRTPEQGLKISQSLKSSKKFQDSRKSETYRQKIAAVQSCPIYVLDSSLRVAMEFPGCTSCANHFGFTRGNIKNAVRHKRQIGKSSSEKFWVVRVEDYESFVNDHTCEISKDQTPSLVYGSVR